MSFHHQNPTTPRPAECEEHQGAPRWSGEKTSVSLSADTRKEAKGRRDVGQRKQWGEDSAGDMLGLEWRSPNPAIFKLTIFITF